MLGSFIQGYNVSGRQFAGSTLDCFTPFTLFCGLALMAGYSLLGAGWLVIKTEGELQAWSRKIGRRCLYATVIAIAVVSVWTPVTDPSIAARWFVWPNIAFLAPVPVITAVLVVYVWRAFNSRSEVGPFVGSLGLFLMSYAGIAISLFPMIVPPHFTLYQAAASPSTQAFLLIGTLFLLPVILIYTAWSYWVFRGKVRADVGYHH